MRDHSFAVWICPSGNRGFTKSQSPHSSLTQNVGAPSFAAHESALPSRLITPQRVGLQKPQPSHSSLIQTVGAPSFAAHESVFPYPADDGRKGWVQNLNLRIRRNIKLASNSVPRQRDCWHSPPFQWQEGNSKESPCRERLKRRRR